MSRRRSKFDFFYVTEKKFFAYLAERDFNVVLQNNEKVTDDGSLSVHFAKRVGVPGILTWRRKCGTWKTRSR